MNAIRLVILAIVFMADMASAFPSSHLVPRTAEVSDIHGILVRPLSAPHQIATVLIFIANDCPISNSYGAEISRLRTDYGASHIAFYVVYTDVNASRATLQAHAVSHGYATFALFDPRHTLVKMTGATVTPEAVAIGDHDQILYEGRIDNRFTGFGLSRDVASVSDLRRALNAIRLGHPVAVSRTQAIGCYIPGV